MALLDRFKAALAKTAHEIRDRLSGATSAGRSEGAAAPAGLETLESVEEALIAADVGISAARRILAEAGGYDGSSRPVRGRVADAIRRILEEAVPPPAGATRPHVVVLVGVNGTGKTTTVGKLAHWYRTRGQSVMVSAADTFRAAAVEQLAVWAERAGVDIVRARPGADPAAVTFDAVSAAKARGRDVVLVDTAGRLHTRANLMAELDKIRRVVAREVPGAPHEVLLVLDATVGQNGLVQAREFVAAGGVNGVVLTKLDGTAKGGIAVAIAHELKLPIRYAGIGERIDDLAPFDASAYVDALFADQ
jgi:fused signal recognition particle receptor